MSPLVLLALAGGVSVAAKLGVLTVASRLEPTPAIQRLGRHVLAATTAAIGLPALAEVSTNPAVGSIPALLGAAVGVGLAATGRPFLVSLPAAMATCAAVGLALP
jgi:hypothetical protein